MFLPGARTRVRALIRKHRKLGNDRTTNEIECPSAGARETPPDKLPLPLTLGVKLDQSENDIR